MLMTVAVSSARRLRPSSGTTAVGINCIAFWYAVNAILGLLVLPWAFQMRSIDGLAHYWILLLVLGTVLSTLVFLGLCRKRRWARYLTIGLSMYSSLGGSVAGLVIFMYMIRPELDGCFK